MGTGWWFGMQGKEGRKRERRFVLVFKFGCFFDF